MEQQELNELQHRSRTIFVGISLLFLLFMLGGILWSVFRIQFLEYPYWMDWKAAQTRDSLIVLPERGNIYSADGALMAATVPSYALYMDMRAYQNRDNQNNPTALAKARAAYTDSLYKCLKPLSAALSRKMGDKTPEEYEAHILKGFKSGSREYLLSRRRVSYFELEEIRAFPFFNMGRNRSGFYQKKYTERKKVFGSLASRTIGDIYPDRGKGGRSGLELKYDSLLRGTPGWSTRQKVAGRYINVVTTPAVEGWDLHTTLDVPTQDIVETALRTELMRINAESGTAILMETATGRVRAISNLGRISPGVYGETQNYAVGDHSEPGSTFKTIAMLAALEDGRVKPNDPVNVGNGREIIHGREMRDHNYNHGGYGMIDAKKSIWYSSNLGVGKLIDEAYGGTSGNRQVQLREASKFVDRIYSFGFNKDLDLEIPGSARPTIPHPKDPNRYWAATDLPWMAHGYVTMIPPIYTLAYYNAIANNGRYLRPYFVDRIERDGKVLKEFKPVVVKDRICSDYALREIRLMLDSVVICGTATAAKSPVVSISGKTGTAVLEYDKRRDGNTRGYQVSFCGYFPSHAPRYTCIVVIRRPGPGHYPSGGTMAGGVVRRIAEQVYSRESFQRVEKFPIDSLSAFPPVKNGLAGPTDKTLQSLHIAADVEASDRQTPVKQGPAGRRLRFSPEVVEEGCVPDVAGMGLRDALYVLESQGLQVVASGQGKVVWQSPKAGQRCRRGQTVEIRLKP